MKILRYILLCLILISLNLTFSQDSLLTALSFYPLNNGDYWEYRDDYWNYSYPPPWYYDSSFYSIQVIGDTVLPNNLKYKILEKRKIPYRDQPFYFFERIDSTTANVYRYREDYRLPNNEYLIDSLLSELGDISKSTRDESDFSFRQTECIYIDTTLILGHETIVKSFWDQSFMPGFKYEIASGFGYVGDFNCEFSCGSTKLLYAKINGIEYGNKISSIQRVDLTLSPDYQLYQNYPNPFNDHTTIKFQVLTPSIINLDIYNARGKKVETLVNNLLMFGQKEIIWNTKSYSSGIYFYRIESAGSSETKKCILIK